MMAAPNLDKAALDSERPVVLAAQREQPGPQVKFSDLIRTPFFAGQQLADRSPIGHIQTLEAAPPPAVQAFHDRWYRPSRAVVVPLGGTERGHASDWERECQRGSISVEAVSYK